jgi:hypothetical protein
LTRKRRERREKDQCLVFRLDVREELLNERFDFTQISRHQVGDEHGGVVIVSSSHVRRASLNRFANFRYDFFNSSFDIVAHCTLRWLGWSENIILYKTELVKVMSVPVYTFGIAN